MTGSSDKYGLPIKGDRRKKNGENKELVEDPPPWSWRYLVLILCLEAIRFVNSCNLKAPPRLGFPS